LRECGDWFLLWGKMQVVVLVDDEFDDRLVQEGRRNGSNGVGC
jgi:hypothetical protein